MATPCGKENWPFAVPKDPHFQGNPPKGNFIVPGNASFVTKKNAAACDRSHVNFFFFFFFFFKKKKKKKKKKKGGLCYMLCE